MVSIVVTFGSNNDESVSDFHKQVGGSEVTHEYFNNTTCI